MADLRLIQTISILVHPDTGPLRYLHELPVHPAEPSLFICVAEFQNPYTMVPRCYAPPFEAGKYRHTSAGQAETFGAGVGRTQEDALWGAIGEALERLYAHIYDPHELIFASQNELGIEALDLSSLILFNEDQYSKADFRYSRADPSRVMGWTQASELGGGKILIPASQAFFGYHFPNGEEAFDASYSTGASSGSGLDAALLGGVLEVVERDAFACHWLLKRSGRKIDTERYFFDFTDLTRELVTFPHVNVELVDLPTDIGIPVVLAMLRMDGDPSIAIGASARLKRAAAIEKAVVEAFHSMNYLLDTRRAGISAPQIEEIRDFKDHLRYYMAPERQTDLTFLTSGSNYTGPLEDLEVRNQSLLAEATGRIEARGYRVLYVDLAPREITDLGLNIVKVFVPGLQPLSCGPGYEHRDPRRLRQFADHHGFPVTQINLAPHPFP